MLRDANPLQTVSDCKVDLDKTLETDVSHVLFQSAHSYLVKYKGDSSKSRRRKRNTDQQFHRIADRLSLHISEVVYAGVDANSYPSNGTT